MNYKEMERFIDIISNKGWSIKNKNSSFLFSNYDFFIEWELSNDLLDKKTEIHFFIIDSLGRESNSIKDILWVKNEFGDTLVFKKENLNEQILFIDNTLKQVN